jgi:citrate lyase gamma subunit
MLIKHTIDLQMRSIIILRIFGTEFEKVVSTLVVQHLMNSAATEVTDEGELDSKLLGWSSGVSTIPL